MDNLLLEVEPRDLTGKGPNRRLRAKGMIPAVIYGEKKDSVAVAVDPKAVVGILRSHAGINTIFGVTVKGVEGTEGTENVMIKDYQLEPIEHELLHADLIRVSMDHAMTVTVHVEIQGIATGVKNEGGVLDFVHRTVDVSCMPADIPETIQVDVTELALGELIRAGELKLPEKVTLESEPGVVIVHVIAPKKVEEAEEEAAAEVEEAPEATEPEVIKKGKAEGEEGSKE